MPQRPFKRVNEKHRSHKRLPNNRQPNKHHSLRQTRPAPAQSFQTTNGRAKTRNVVVEP
jgi:hypothetical protein